MRVAHQRGERDRSDVPSIAELIRAELDSGKTVRSLAKASGDRVRFQTFQNLSRHPPKEFPKEPKTITGMALALGVPETTIVLAYAAGLGIRVMTDSAFALRLPADVDRLDSSLQDALINLIRAARRSGHELPGRDRESPLAPPSHFDEGDDTTGGLGRFGRG